MFQLSDETKKNDSFTNSQYIKMGNLSLSLLLYQKHVMLTIQSGYYDDLRVRQLESRRGNCAENNHAGMQKEELKVGGKTQTK